MSAATEARTLAIRGEEQEVALGELDAILAVSRDEERRAALTAARDAVAAGALPEDAQDTVEQVLTLALQAGRVRARYGPGGEAAALRLSRRLPGGAELAASARDVTAALQALVGKELEGVSVGVIGPGSYTLELASGGAELSIRLDASGARVQSVGV